jgi:hypothetical protein
MQDLSDAYRAGWQQTRRRWAAGPKAPAEKDTPALSWLITTWHRATAQR